VRDAAFGYGDAPVIAGVNLDIRRGAFLGLLGPNGAGKTTLFRGLLGLIAPMRGTVERNASAVGYVPQRESLDAVFPVTVEEVVQMGAYARLRGWRRLAAEDREQALQCLERVDLLHRKKALFSSLSGGQRQRALIARSLMSRPQVLMLDEPTSGVDQPTQELILELLTRLNEEDGLAILIVSHQVAMTRTVREVAWVADGSVRLGKAEEMLRPDAHDVFGAHFGAPLRGKE